MTSYSVNIIISCFDFKINHTWIHLNTIDVLSIDGWSWFLKRKIYLSRICSFFLAQPNIEGPIHIDHKTNDVAFNFVLRGHGEMQWLDIKADEYISNTVTPGGPAVHQYIRFENIKEMSMIDSWRGSRGMVRIGTPHRIVTADCPRVCLSFRQTNNRFKRFDELSNVF